MKKKTTNKLQKISRFTINLWWGFGAYVKLHKSVGNANVSIGKTGKIEVTMVDEDAQYWEISIKFMMFWINFRWLSKLNNDNKLKLEGFYSNFLPNRFNTK